MKHDEKERKNKEPWLKIEESNNERWWTREETTRKMKKKSEQKQCNIMKNRGKTMKNDEK